MLALLLGVALSAVAARVASYLAFVRRLAALPSPPPAAHGRCTLLSRLRTALAGHAGELTEGRWGLEWRPREAGVGTQARVKGGGMPGGSCLDTPRAPQGPVGNQQAGTAPAVR